MMKDAHVLKRLIACFSSKITLMTWRRKKRKRRRYRRNN
ncbi:hypothetical protein SLEP1_g58566 [Rubroshorea leprosula]|uniref:Uncharacterized protein n=1 Tax=Rubroshorea leprosula TaxID=152421 RepID=A0AAV5MPP7_9ROSI|nr:hypothetical protein SLEP1_g58566 [Rubroshorea leprosula]